MSIMAQEWFLSWIDWKMWTIRLRVVAMTELLLFQTMWQWPAPVNVTIVFPAMLGARLVRIRCQVQGLKSLQIDLDTRRLSFTYFTYYYTPIYFLKTDRAKMITTLQSKNNADEALFTILFHHNLRFPDAISRGQLGGGHICVKALD